MARGTSAGGADARRLPGPGRVNYAGAVYGSLLAASVVAGAGTPGPYPRLELALLLLCTGVVFWAAHVYAGFVGERLREQPVSRADVRRICTREWPIVQAAFLPAALIASSPLLGLGFRGAAWLGLGAAVVQQVLWASAAVLRAGAAWWQVVSAGVVNLLLGLVLVVAKVWLQH
ncbi:hypothetical protein LO771_13915 [Streptacidiphilus sp. ASG 303]|uniref:hypothetical protein n=1 Tax=Streptacidiphilus sp. ASG 303 TaxID=2896847 RepID=UPI001E2FFCF3|nr:hypothetical protein [Streptacidiphilus sp. ASG 303]MCD0483465.1 hypothetical protein [Streptacidiphilus sp. ASG 303]